MKASYKNEKFIPFQ